jgi:hypothetical protein
MFTFKVEKTQSKQRTLVGQSGTLSLGEVSEVSHNKCIVNLCLYII